MGKEQIQIQAWAKTWDPVPLNSRQYTTKFAHGLSNFGINCERKNIGNEWHNYMKKRQHIIMVNVVVLKHSNVSQWIMASCHEDDSVYRILSFGNNIQALSYVLVVMSCTITIWFSLVTVHICMMWRFKPSQEISSIDSVRLIQYSIVLQIVVKSSLMACTQPLKLKQDILI